MSHQNNVASPDPDYDDYRIMTIVMKKINLCIFVNVPRLFLNAPRLRLTRGIIDRRFLLPDIFNAGLYSAFKPQRMSQNEQIYPF